MITGKLSVSEKCVSVFEEHRAQLRGLAYRITGSYLEAEDIVHETFIKWFHAEQATIESPYAWLVKVATRLSLDYVKSARVKRESYIGPWLPEPYIDDKETPESKTELDQSISMAMMVLLDSLNASERACYVLHDLFQMSFDEIAGLLEKSPPSCRKLASRARAKISSDSSDKKFEVKNHERIVGAFFNAIQNGDMAELTSLFKSDVVFHSDGGGKAAASLKVLYGCEAVARFLIRAVTPNITVNRSKDANEQARCQTCWFNGAPGGIITLGDKTISAFHFDVVDGEVAGVYALRNPDKLALFNHH